MIENIIMLLIYICVLALVVYLVLWVLQDVLGLAIPPKVVQIIWVIVVLVVILLILRILLPGISKGHLFGMLDFIPMLA